MYGPVQYSTVQYSTVQYITTVIIDNSGHGHGHESLNDARNAVRSLADQHPGWTVTLM